MPDTPVKKLKINCPGCQSHLDVTELPPFTVFNCPRCGIEVKVPQYWNNYVLEDPLIKEPHRAVYRSLDTALDREVLIEMLLPEGNYTESEGTAYQTVLRSLAQLNLPACCAIYGCAATSDNVIYAVTEYIPKHLPLESPQPWKTISEWLTQCCQTLSKAADNGIFHGRLSADCMHLRENGQLCLDGFGLGTIRPDDASKPLSAADDIYSLGKIFAQAMAKSDHVPMQLEKLLHAMTGPDPKTRPGYTAILSTLQNPEGKKTLSKGSAKGRKVDVAKIFTQESSTTSSGSKLAGALLLLVILGLIGTGIWFWLVKGKQAPSAQSPVAPGVSANTENTDEASDTIAEADVQAEQSKLPPISLEQAKWTPLTSEQRASRPRPKNPQVYQSRKVRAWLEALPPEYREGAVLQARLLMNLHDMLQGYVLKNNYDRGPGTTILLRNGQKYNACISFGNDQGMRLKSLDDKEIPTHVTFDQLSRKTIQDMLVFYGEYSLSRLSKSSPEYTKGLRALVRHYLLLTLLCDWYGETENASRYAGICVYLSPKSEHLLKHFGIKPLTYTPTNN